MVDIIHRIGIKATPAKVYAALSTVDGVAGWWTEETTGDSKVGGIVTVRFRDRGAAQEKGAVELEVTGLDPVRTAPLLSALELDKALYEVIYEVRNRPSWLEIPLAAVERLVADTSSDLSVQQSPSPGRVPHEDRPHDRKPR